MHAAQFTGLPLFFCFLPPLSNASQHAHADDVTKQMAKRQAGKVQVRPGSAHSAD